MAKDRLSELPDGRIALELKTPWFDGTHTLAFDPLDFLAKLAALVPRPHKNLIVYNSVISAHARLRERAVTHGREPSVAEPLAAVGGALVPKHQRRQWADVMRRAFGYDLLSCANCGGKMVLLACITRRAGIAKILSHFGSNRPRWR